MKKFMILFLFFTAFLKLEATEPDTVWTKDVGLSFGWVELADAKFTPDGNNILIATRGGVKLISRANGSFIRDYNIPSENIHNVVFSPDGNKFVVACWDGNAFVVDFSTGLILSTLKHDAQGVNVHCFSKDGKKIFTTSGNHLKDIFIWDSDKYTLINNFGGTKGGDADFLALSNDEKIIATVGSINNINGDWYYILRLWSLDSFKILSEQSIANNYIKVHDMQMSPDGKYIATAESDSTAKIWDSKTGTLVYTLYPGRISKDYFVGSSFFSNDSKFLITGIFPLKLLIWDLETKEMIKQYEYGSWIGGITKDNKYILTFNSNNLILLNAKWEPDGIRENLFNSNDYPIITPNPATKLVNIEFEQPQNSVTAIKLYDLSGNLVNQLLNEFLTSGTYKRTFDLSSLADGTYLCRIQSSNYLKTYKLIKIK